MLKRFILLISSALFVSAAFGHAAYHNADFRIAGMWAWITSDGIDLVNTSADHETRVAALEAQVTAMDAYIQQLETYIVVDESTDPSRPTVRVVGANLQVVNGMGSSSTINGVGNLLVGYDEVRNVGDSVCADGSLDFGNCFLQGEVWALSHKSGSHNLVIGNQHNYSRYGGLVAGSVNTINGDHANVSGGQFNIASRDHTSVSGGLRNSASQLWSVVSGGEENVASGASSSVSGGFQNSASGSRSSVTGGRSNSAINQFSTVSGGNTRSVTGIDDWRAGGLFETN